MFHNILQLIIELNNDVADELSSYFILRSKHNINLVKFFSQAKTITAMMMGKQFFFFNFGKLRPRSLTI